MHVIGAKPVVNFAEKPFYRRQRVRIYHALLYERINSFVVVRRHDFLGGKNNHPRGHREARVDFLGSRVTAFLKEHLRTSGIDGSLDAQSCGQRRCGAGQRVQQSSTSHIITHVRSPHQRRVRELILSSSGVIYLPCPCPPPTSCPLDAGPHNEALWKAVTVLAENRHYFVESKPGSTSIQLLYFRPDAVVRGCGSDRRLTHTPEVCGDHIS